MQIEGAHEEEQSLALGTIDRGSSWLGELSQDCVDFIQEIIHLFKSDSSPCVVLEMCFIPKMRHIIS